METNEDLDHQGGGFISRWDWSSAMKCAALENLSTITRMAILSSDRGRPVTKSMERWDHCIVAQAENTEDLEDVAWGSYSILICCQEVAVANIIVNLSWCQSPGAGMELAVIQ